MISVRAKKPSGFTLIEMLIVVALVTVCTFFLAPMVKEMLGAFGNASRKHQENVNNKLANALLKYARTQSTLGKLPLPHTGGRYYSVPVNPSDATMLALTDQLGVNRRELNDDGKSNPRAKVFQVENDLTINQPLFYQSGPVVTLTYSIGVVYQTDCPLNEGCNKAPYSGISPAYNTTTATNWQPTHPEYAAAPISTLPLQQSMLSSTANVIERLRDALLSYAKDRAMAAAANDASNFFPIVTTPPAIGPLGGRSPATNQGCRDGWYALNDASVTILDELSLNRGQFGVTAWGGSIEFCRKYDPAETGSETIAPHFGALRINKDVSKGIPPSAVTSNNIIITF